MLQTRPSIVHNYALKPIAFGALAAKIARIRGVVNAPVGLGFVYGSDTFKARALRPVIAFLLRYLLHPAGG